MKKVVSRFAPSPTGFMHVGGVRTALYAWLLARQSSDGKFILRIEDTDKVREVEGSITQIENSLRWLGITWDEGVDIGGPNGPYKQSERLGVYREWAQKLIESGRAYADPYTPEEMGQFREQAKKNQKPFLFRDHRPESPPVWDGTQPLRFKSDPKNYSWTDQVMGNLSTGPEVVDDFIILKSDGYPTYNFAHIIDDHLMGVTHVLRSQEFISSVPKYLNLYEALDFTPPVFATLPYVMAIDGKKKLGKRDGAKDIMEYAQEGYLPEAMMNFLATLGWNDGSEQEVFTKKELIDKFSLDRVHKSPARFDEKRLLWLNGQHIRSLTLNDLSNRIDPFWPHEAAEWSEDYRNQVLKLAQARLKTLTDLPALTSFFFTDPTPNWTMIEDNKQLKKITRQELSDILKKAQLRFEQVDFKRDTLAELLNQLMEEMNLKPAILMGIIRLAITWSPFSPELPETLSLIGKERTLKRIETAISMSTS